MATDKFSSNAPAVGGPPVRCVALSVSAVDQTLADIPSAFWCTASGSYVGRLLNDTADQTFVMVSGTVYPGRFAIARHTGTTVSGVFLYAL